MANKSFVVQYLIKAREQYVAIVDKVRRSTRDLRKEVAKTRNELALTSTNALSTARANATFAQTVEATRAPVRRLKRDLKETARSMRNWGAGVAIGGLVALNGLKNAARDATETRSKFAAVYKDVEANANANATNLADNYGLSRTASKKLLADTGDVLTGFGFGQKEALGFSTQVAQLATDLASFTNYAGGAEGASSALTKAMLGEREMLKGLGIAISEKAVDTKISQLMAEGEIFTSLRQAKAQATLALAFEQSKNAVGDYARTQNDLANQERRTAASWANLKTSLGDALLPLFVGLNIVVRGVLNGLDRLSPTVKRFIVGALVAATVVAGVVTALGGMLLLLPLLKAGLVSVGISAGFAFGPVLLAVAALSLAAYFLISDWRKVQAFFEGFGTALDTTFGPTLGRLVEHAKAAARIVAQLFGNGSDAYESLNEFKNLGELVGSIVGGFLDLLVRGLSGIGAVVGQLMAAIISRDFSQFDTTAIMDEFRGAQKVQSSSSRVDVGVNVGLDPGLRQTSAAAVTAAGIDRTDIGVMTQ